MIATLAATELSKNRCQAVPTPEGIASQPLVLAVRSGYFCQGFTRPLYRPGGAAHPIAECGDSRPETFIRTTSVFVNLWYQKAYNLFYRNLAMACQPGFAEFFSFFASTLLWRWGDSNPRHRGCKPRALPLSYIPVALIFVTPTGRTWIRTKDLSFIRAAL